MSVPTHATLKFLRHPQKIAAQKPIRFKSFPQDIAPVVGREAEAEAEMDEDRVKAVSERLWIIILSKKQEKLIPLNDWVAVVEAHLARGGKK